MVNRREALHLLAGAALAPAALRAESQDWPQWRGPNRDGLSSETGLAPQWPSGGPKQLWRIEGLGSGYGSMAIVGDRMYVQGGTGSESAVHCLSTNEPKKLWTKVIGRQGSNDRGDGPRSTPTIDGNLAYVLTENGDLACLRTADGTRVWQKNILAEFGGSNPNWLLSESPLIDGEKLIVTPGGSGAGMVALNKANGETIWKSADLSDPAGYSSVIIAEVGRVRCYITLNARAGVGVRASDGKLLWRYTNPANRVANCATPVFSSGQVFYTSAYGTGCGLLALSTTGDEVQTREVYFNRDMMNHHGGVVLVNGFLYGFSNAILTCMEFETGKVMWRDRSVGKGCLTYASGHLYLVGEGQTVGLAVATPEAYQEKGRFTIPDLGSPSWAHPVVCRKRLYVRNQGMIQCFDVSA